MRLTTLVIGIALLCGASHAIRGSTKKTSSSSSFRPHNPRRVVKSRGRGSHGGMANPPRVPASLKGDPTRPTVANCTERWFTQKMDHFAFTSHLPTGVPETFQQRYFTCLTEKWQPGSPIFYYTGNEVDVTLFVESTGLMWENAPSFGAMLIFAEHRYFGRSLPFPNQTMPTPDKLQWLTTDQALADYATHIEWYKKEYNAATSKVVGFGGSYGGMLCSWLRVKYPSALDACIAGSAPIANFEDMTPRYNAESFASQVTFDATAAGGCPNDLCAARVRSVYSQIKTLALAADYQPIQEHLNLCTAPTNQDDVEDVYAYISGAFAYMAMSSYPFPSDYLLLGGGGILPAYPERVSCGLIANASNSTSSSPVNFYSLSAALNVYYNATGAVQCFNVSGNANEETIITTYLWGYLACTTMFMPSGQDGVQDMFNDAPWNSTAEVESCIADYGGYAVPQPDWVKINYGGKGVATWGSNIFFSNGQLDPWRPGGILNATAPTVHTALIPDSGHHIDLMFGHPQDTAAIKAVRKSEMQFVLDTIAPN